MKGADLRGSTPFWLTVKLVGIFSVAMLVSFVAALLFIRGYLDAELRDELAREIAAWQAAAEQGDIEQQIAEATTRTAAESQIVALTTLDGRRISNVPDFGSVDATRVVRAEEIPSDAKLADSYLVAVAEVSGGRLVLGASRDRVEELGETFTTILLVAVLPTIALATVLGLATAETTRQRVEAIRQTLARITAGDLAARLPEGSRDDDLGHIAGAVNQMAAAQAASIASLRQVSADIAHDLKTPIQRVSVLLERLETAGSLAPAQAEALTAARAETQQIAKTFQALLQIAQVEAGGVRSNFSEVDFGAIVAGVAEIYGPAAEKSGHRLDCRIPPDPVRVSGDRNLLGQILANLIENALRHTPSGCSVVVSLRADGTLTVADNGPGVPADERQSVLQRFYRLDRSRTTDGSGLGLSLVAAVADLHGAVVELEDAGPGLRVTLRFALVHSTG